MAGNNETSVIITAIDNTEAALNSVKGNVGAVTGQFERLGGVVSGFAALAGVTAFAGIIKGSIDSAAGLHDLSQKTGATVESLSALRGAAKLADVEMDTVSGGLQKLSKNMMEAASGSGDALKIFNALGISVRDSSGNLKASDAVMMEFSKSLQTVSSGSERAAAAQVVLGKSGAQLMPLLNDLALTGELQAKITAEQAAAADNFGDTLIKLQAVHKSWVTTVAMEVLPAANAFAEAMLEMAVSSNGMKQTAKDLAADGSIQSWSKSAAMGIARVIDVVQVAAGTFTQFQQSMAVVMKDVETVAKVAALGVGAGFTAEGQAAIKQALKERSEFVKAANEDLQKWWNPELFSDKLAKKFEQITSAAPAAAEATKSLASALKDVKDKSDKAAAALAALRLDQMALIHKQASAELDAIAKAQEEYGKNVAALIDPLNKQAAELERQVEYYGMTESAIQQTIVARLEEARQLAAENGAWEEHLAVLDQEIEARKRIASAASQVEYLDANKKAAADAARRWENFARDIEQSLTDSLYRSFEAGKGFGQSFIDSLKNTLKTTVLKVAVQAIIGTSGSLVNAGINALLGTSGSNGGTGNNYLGTANNASSLYNLWGAGSALAGGTVGASSASLLYANAVGAVGGDSLGALIAANGGWSAVPVGTTAAGGAAAGGGSAGTGSAAGTAASMWPLAIVAGMYMSSKLFDSGYKFDNSAFKTDDPRTWSMLAQYGAYNEANTIGKLWGDNNFGDSKFWQVATGANLSRYVDEAVQKFLGIRGGGDKYEAFGGDRSVSWGLAQSAPTNSVLTEIATGLESQFNSILETFGKSAQDIVVGLGMDSDPKGDASARMGYALKVGSQSIFSESDVSGLSLEAIKNNANRALIAALQAVDISEPVNAYLDSLGEIGKLTAEQITTSLGVIDTYHGLNKAMADLNLGADSLTTGLLNAFGGVDGLKTALNDYYNNFYTAEEKRARVVSQITATLNAAGANLSEATVAAASRPDFRHWLEGIDESNAALRAAGLQVEGAFASITDSMEHATTAAQQQAAEWDKFTAQVTGNALQSIVTKAKDKLAAAEQELQDAYQREVETQTSQIESLTQLADSLRDARLSMLASDNTVAGSSAYRYALSKDALASASPDNVAERVKSFLDASQSHAATRMDYLRDLALGSGAMASAEGDARGKISVAEQQLAVSKSMVSSMVELTGGVLSLRDALAGVQQAKAGVLRAKFAVATANIANTDPRIAMLEAQYRAGLAALGLPSYDVGTNYVPRDMVAKIHEGEAIIPKAYNPAAGGAMNAELVAELRALREENAQLRQTMETRLSAIEQHSRSTSNAVNGNPARRVPVEVKA